MAVSTYTLAVEAYDEIRGVYDSSGLIPPEDDLTPTYGSYAIAVRRTLRMLNQYKGRTYDESLTVSIDDSDADDFRNLINYFILARLESAAAGSANKIKLGPLEITNSSYSSLQGLLSRYALRLQPFGFLVGGQIKIVDLDFDWESDYPQTVEYVRDRFRGW